MCFAIIYFARHQQQGTIVYEELNLHRRLEDEQMKTMIPGIPERQRHDSTNSAILSLRFIKAVKEEEAPDLFVKLETGLNSWG